MKKWHWIAAALGLELVNLCRYERGADSLAVIDWDTGEESRIPLDPSIQAKDQAEALYKRARKLRRTTGNVEPLLREVLRFLR